MLALTRTRSCAAALLLALALAGPAAVADEVGDAARQAAEEFAAALPAPLPAGSVAVQPIAGDDDDRLRDALEEALSSREGLRVVTRRHVDAIISEQGLQVQDLVEPESRVRFGRLVGAEALVVGRVEWSVVPGRAGAEARLQLVSTETGDLLATWSSGVAAEATWWRRGLSLLAAAALALVLLGLWRSWTGGNHEQRFEAAARARSEAARQVKRARESLTQAAEVAGDEELRAAAGEAEGVERTLQEAPAGLPAQLDSSGSRRLLRADRTAAKACRAAAERAERALAKARDGRAAGGDLQDVLKAVRTAASALSDRGIS